MSRRSWPSSAAAHLAVMFGLVCVLFAPVCAKAAVPSRVRVFYATAVSQTSVDLAWHASAGASTYNIKRSTVTGGPYTTLATGLTGTSYVSSGLANDGTKYFYVMTATNADGTSSNSNELVVVTPNPSDTSPISVTATVDWATAKGTTTSALFGTNDLPLISTPAVCGAPDTAYSDALEQIGVQMYRFHGWYMSEYQTCGTGAYWTGWTDTNQTWNPTIVQNQYAGQYLQGATIMQNIPGSPPWLPSEPYVNPTDYGNFAAGLVGLVKTLPGTKAVYWEPINEWNNIAGMTPTQVVNVFNASATAMKAQDPSIKLVGPALSWPDQNYLIPFLQNCGDNVDVVSWHYYGTCNSRDSNDSILGRIPNWAYNDVKTVQNLINSYAPGRNIQTALDEYNIQCAWDGGEVRTFSNIGAVFHASVLKNLAYAGCNIATNWGSKGGMYGMIADDNTLVFPVTTLMTWANRYLVGTLADVTSTNTKFEVFAVVRADNTRTVVLINKSSGTATVTQNLGLGTNVNIGRIDATGVYPIASGTLGSTITMPPLSITIITVPGGPPPAPTGLTATPGNAQVSLAWTANPSATSYNVLRSTTSGSGYSTVATGITTTSYTNTGLTNGTTYYYLVRAVNSAGTSPNSAQVSATPNAPPPVPTGLTATAGVQQVALSWNPSAGAASYNVLRSLVSGSNYLPVASGVTTTSYTNTGLTPGTTYYYVVQAVANGVASGNSNQASATPTISLPVQINTGGLAVSPFIEDTFYVGGTKATNWTGAIDTSAVSNPAPQAVYHSERYGQSTYTIGGLAANAGYTVRLHFCENYFTTAGSRVFNAAINGTTVLTNYDIFAATGAAHKADIQQFSATSDASGKIVVALTNVTNNALINGIEILSAGGSAPPAPTGLTATAGNGQVVLSWTASSGATSYNVKRSTTSGSGYSTVGTSTDTTHTDSSLTNGTTYYYVVSAVNSVGESSNSSQVSATPTNQGTYGNSGNPWSIASSGTTRIEVENYDTGGQGVAYNDADTTNNGGQYRTSEGVDVETTGDTGGGHNVGWVSAGEWLEYTVNVASAGTYDLKLRVARSPTGTSTVRVLFNGTDKTGSISVPSTGGWQTWTTITKTGVSLSAGQQVMRIDLTGSSFNVNWVELTAASGSPPATPTGLAATPGDAQVALNWNASTGATSYNLKRSTTSGSGYTTIASPTTTSYTNTGLTNGTTYYYVVSAVNSNGESGNSSQVSATPSAPSGGNTHGGTWAVRADFTSTPTWTNFQQWAGVASNSTYTASFWMKGSGKVLLILQYGAPDYAEITRQTFTATSSWTQFSIPNIATTGHSQILYRLVDSGGVAGTAYIDDCFLGVSGGTNTLGNPGFESGNTVWTNPSSSPFTIEQPGGGSPPAAPTGLTATPGNGQVALSWTASSGATSYNVKRSTTSGSGYSTIASPTSTSYTNTGLTNGTTYYYVVSAVNSNGESGNSSQVSATPGAPPAAPTGLAATPGNGQVALNWTASSGATSYRVKRSTTSGSGYTTIASPTTTSYTNTGLTNGTTYYYVVSAVNSAGESANSSQASATPTAPVGTGNTHAGTWAVKGVFGSTATWKNLQQWAGVASNSTYTASFWMKGSGKVTLILQYGGPDYAEITRQTFTATSTWTQYSIPSVATTGHSQILYRLVDSGGVAGTVYIDDCFLGVSGGTNTLGNPGFESGDTVWTKETGSPFTILQNP